MIEILLILHIDQQYLSNYNQSVVEFVYKIKNSNYAVGTIEVTYTLLNLLIAKTFRLICKRISRNFIFKTMLLLFVIIYPIITHIEEVFV